MDHIIKAAREFPELSDHEVINIASIRRERAENVPAISGNTYIKILDRFEENEPVFKWVNLTPC